MDIFAPDVLPVVWAGLIGISVALYVILDGFDLGVALLFPFRPAEHDRDLMMNSVAPFWDGNETWLVLGGGALWVAFPTAYAIIMPALYIPVIVMLLALIFRGVAFEFRWVAKPNHRLWDVAFAAGSFAAAFAQGIVLGGIIEGIRVEDGTFAGGPFDWATPFALLCGLGLVAGYALLGATWLAMRVSGPVEDWARRIARPLLYGLLAFILAVSIWTPLQFDRIADRWFSWPNVAFLAPVPILTVGFAAVVLLGLDRRHASAPFLGSVALFLLAFAGLAISEFPYIVPGALTVWEATSPATTQVFLLVGVLVLLPLVLAYSVFVYWTFRGRVRPGEGYH
jgi:cytochrome d ubiquinol oxidase subunit II